MASSATSLQTSAPSEAFNSSAMPSGVMGRITWTRAMERSSAPTPSAVRAVMAPSAAASSSSAVISVAPESAVTPERTMWRAPLWSSSARNASSTWSERT